jgi:hypothetical protein
MCSIPHFFGKYQVMPDLHLQMQKSKGARQLISELMHN